VASALARASHGAADVLIDYKEYADGPWQVGFILTRTDNAVTVTRAFPIPTA
jgi:hypothetical protein